MILTRPHFDIRDGSPQTLDDIAEFTMQLFDHVPDVDRFKPQFQLTLTLYGVPRNQLITVQKELESRLEPLGFKTNLFGPPGTSTVTTDEAKFNVSPVSGLGVSHLEGKPFDGLVLELRFTIRARNSAIVEIDSSLVLVGELQSGRLQIRALCREGRAGDPDKVFQNSVWSQEARFWSLFQEFQDDDLRETKETLQLAQAFFLNARWERRVAAIQRTIMTPFRIGQSRIRGLLVRALEWSGLAFVGLFIQIQLAATVRNLFHEAEMFWWAISLCLFGPLVLFLTCEIYLLWSIWRVLSNRFYPLYRQASHLAEARPETVLEHTSNCYYQQVAEELRDHGYRLLGQQEMMFGSKTYALLSIFANDQDCVDVGIFTIREDTAVFEQSGLQYWPASITVATRSKFSDESINVMLNNFSDAWKRILPGNVRMCCWPHIEDLEQHLQLHKQWCEEYMQQHGVSPVPRSYAEILRMQKERMKQDYEYYGKKPFTLGDLLNFWLQRTRRAYRS